MNDLIYEFFKNNYTEETQELLYGAIGLFAVFNYPEPLGSLVDLMTMEGNIEKDTIVEGVRGYIEKGIDTLMFANRIKVFPEVTLRDKVRLLEAIFAFTKIEDPEPYLPYMDGWMSNEEIMAKCIGEVLGEPYETFFPMLSWVFDGTIARFKDYLENMKIENETLDTQALKEIRKNLRVFNKVFGQIPVIESLEEINPIKNQEFKLYIDLFKESLIDPDDMENTVFGLMWIAMISSDGYKNPKMLLMEYGKELFADYAHHRLYDSMLTTAFGKYISAREVEQ